MLIFLLTTFGIIFVIAYALFVLLQFGIGDKLGQRKYFILHMGLCMALFITCLYLRQVYPVGNEVLHIKF